MKKIIKEEYYKWENIPDKLNVVIMNKGYGKSYQQLLLEYKKIYKELVDIKKKYSDLDLKMFRLKAFVYLRYTSFIKQKSDLNIINKKYYENFLKEILEIIGGKYDKGRF